MSAAAIVASDPAAWCCNVHATEGRSAVMTAVNGELIRVCLSRRTKGASVRLCEGEREFAIELTRSDRENLARLLLGGAP